MQNKNIKHKKFKPLLCMGIVSMIMCCVVLLGTTFAWMTDNLIGSVARIEAETLSFDLLDVSGKSVIEQDLVFSKVNDDGTLADVSEGTVISWESGVTYQLPAMRAINTGTMDMVCTVSVKNASTEENSIDISNIIDFTITVDGTVVDGNGFTLFADAPTTTEVNEGQSGDIIIQGKLKENIAETYAGQSLSIIIRLDAQQAQQ